MTKPKAKKVNGNRSNVTANGKISKKIQKPHGTGNGTQLRKRLKSEVENSFADSPQMTNIEKVIKRKAGKKETTAPGQFVLAPPPLTDPSDSDSEDEAYIDRFFEDVEDFEENGDGDKSTTESESEPSEESEDDNSSMEKEDEIEAIQEDEQEVELEEWPEEESETAPSSDDDSFIDVANLLNGSSQYDFSPSELLPELIMDDYSDDYSHSDCSFDYDDCDEISIESYTDDSESSEESDPDEYVQGNCRFVDMNNSAIPFPSEGASIVEIRNDSDDECPELVPLPKSLIEKPSPKIDPKPPMENTSMKYKSDTDVANLDCYLSQDFSEVLVHVKDTFYFHGNVSMKVIAGSINILQHLRTHESPNQEFIANATVDDYPVQIFINDHPVPSISRCLGELGVNRFHYSQLMHIKKSFKNHQAVILMRPVELNHLKLMQTHMSKKLIPDEFRTNYETILKCKFYKNPPCIFQTVNLDAAQPNDERAPRIITVGGKNTGKSTFNKCLGNAILTLYPRYVHVDLDIGQPEYGVPQTLSAHVIDTPTVGRGFLKCHKVKLQYSVVYGHINVALDPVRYVACVDSLFKHLYEQDDLQDLIWVVNTMGYVRGAGLDIMHFILSKLQPTKVLQFQHPVHHLENFPRRLDPSFMVNYESNLLPSTGITMDYEWNCGPTFIHNPKDDVRQLKGSEGRQMNILCHLGLALNSNFVSSFNEVEPICAPLDKLTIINTGESCIPRGCLLDAINGNMVYLCRLDGSAHALPEYQGVAIVRSVDKEAQKVYLVTGMPKSNLKKVNCLALTSMPLPFSLLMSQHAAVSGSSNVPYICQAGSKSILFRNIIDRPFRTDSAAKH